MSEFDSKGPFDDDAVVFDLEGITSSGDIVRKTEVIDDDILELSEVREEVPEDRLKTELSPVMKELASFELPPLEKENRAWLHMQSPNRLFFYWSMKNNPFQMLNRAFGGNTGSYTLVAKLINLTRDTEEIYPVEAEGNWWFNVDSDTSYRAEIGFYAPNRPYVRVMFSNTVSTPRKRPSPRVATAADWNISANRFAQVLNVSGFKQDAFEVSLAGDDAQSTPSVNHEAFARFIKRDHSDFAGIASDELRYTLLLIASGVSIEQLRYRIDASLFTLLQKAAEKLSVENALIALKEQFGIEAEEMFEEEPSGAVFGASLVNFPSKIRRSRTLPEISDYQPVSSPIR
jgi:hypothetical protein